MCMRCLGTPANFKWPGELIYIGLQVDKDTPTLSKDLPNLSRYV